MSDTVLGTGDTSKETLGPHGAKGRKHCEGIHVAVEQRTNHM